jgi:hypothetical protein
VLQDGVEDAVVIDLPADPPSAGKAGRLARARRYLRVKMRRQSPPPGDLPTKSTSRACAFLGL